MDLRIFAPEDGRVAGSGPGAARGSGREPVAVDPGLQTRIESLVAQRGEARRRRDFGEADRLREELRRMGVGLEDTPGGTSWKVRS